MKENKEKIIEFLKESNAIEGVYDDDSLKQAKYAWDFLSKQEKLTIGVILKTHKILMLHKDLNPDEKGYFRKCAVWIGYRMGMPVSSIPEKMENWVKLMSQEDANAKELHVMYEHIHPFVDGNGRTGRMFMNWLRLKQGKSLLVIKESEKYDYYGWFN